MMLKSKSIQKRNINFKFRFFISSFFLFLINLSRCLFMHESWLSLLRIHLAEKSFSSPIINETGNLVLQKNTTQRYQSYILQNKMIFKVFTSEKLNFKVAFFFYHVLFCVDKAHFIKSILVCQTQGKAKFIIELWLYRNAWMNIDRDTVIPHS